eukprot:gene5-biopygen8987
MPPSLELEMKGERPVHRGDEGGQAAQLALPRRRRGGGDGVGGAALLRHPVLSRLHQLTARSPAPAAVVAGARPCGGLEPAAPAAALSAAKLPAAAASPDSAAAAAAVSSPAAFTPASTCNDRRSLERVEKESPRMLRHPPGIFPARAGLPTSDEETARRVPCLLPATSDAPPISSCRPAAHCTTPPTRTPRRCTTRRTRQPGWGTQPERPCC